MSEGEAFVRGYGDLAGGSGALAWSLAGGGAVILENGRASAAGIDAGGDGNGPWAFETRLEGDALGGAAVFRQIAVDAGEGSTILCTAVGAQGIAGHAEERATAIRESDDALITYDDALISTQYDGAGEPTRFGLELWPPDADQTARAAATRVSATLLGGARSGGAWAGLFRCHTDGAEGMGAYLLWRA